MNERSFSQEEVQFTDSGAYGDHGFTAMKGGKAFRKCYSVLTIFTAAWMIFGRKRGSCREACASADRNRLPRSRNAEKAASFG